MWTLNLKNDTNPKQDIVLSGGYSINDKLGGRGESYRLMVMNDGYIDIIDCSQPGELEYAYVIYFNGIRFRKVEGDNSDIIINLTINDDKTFCIDKAGNLLTGSLSSYPSIERSDIDSFNWMVDSKFIPYQKITDDPGKRLSR